MPIKHKQTAATAAKRAKHSLKDFEESPVQQHLVAGANANAIVKRIAGGHTDQIKTTEGKFYDASQSLSFQDAMNIVTKAEQTFDKLAPELRLQFDNDPVAFVNFMDNEENAEQQIKMGLRRAPKAVQIPATTTKTEEAADAATEGSKTGGEAD